MKALVVYESFFNNTRQIAEAIAAGLAPTFDTEVVEVGSASTDLADHDLVVIGGPTHVWSMSRPSTRASGREQAAEQGIDPPSDGIGIREWLDGLSLSPPTKVAAFDTGVGKIGFVSAGSAAKKISTRLRSMGLSLAADPEQFLISVEDGETLLKDGELARAEGWGANLARTA